MSENLPFLPGYRIETKLKSQHHKAHFFDVKNGIRVDVNRDVVPTTSNGTTILGNDPLLLSTSQLDYEKSFNKTTPTLENPPAWVAYDRKVLRFYCYFNEAVHASAIETSRVRKCILYYYLEDDSIHIAEPKVENSGLPQGVIVKRHRIPKQNGEFISYNDLYIGAEVNIYSRTYYFTDCDQFTRAFYESNGCTLSDPLPVPTDAFDAKATTTKPMTNNKMMHPHKLFIEASLGKSMYGKDVAGTQQFLKNDGKVLRFYAVWNDVKLYGEKQAFIIHYFLADDTIEVLEVQKPNSGRDSFPALLKRGKLPKNYHDHVSDFCNIGENVYTMNNKERYYHESDFKIGEYIMVYGRKLLLCGADKFTQDYYVKNYNMSYSDFPKLKINDDEDIELPKILPPPHTGFGKEEDSLGSFLYLMQKVPKQDFKKLMENDGLVMRFLAKFSTPQPEDRDRLFIITFYLNNDNISVFEKFERNSGFIGGKFLEKCKLKNFETGEYFKPTDFYAGAKLCINRFWFDLINVDDRTKNWMDDNKHIFAAQIEKQNEYLQTLSTTQRETTF